MGKSQPTAPPAPDPVKTAEAQQTMNQNTATTQQLLNMINQVTPDGSLTYNQTGTNSFVGADGKTYTVPQFTATQSLSPTGQKLLDTTNVTKQNLADAGVTASNTINSVLGKPVDLSNDAVEQRLFELGSARLTPQFQRDENALRTQLINAGIRPGTEAWNTEMTRLSQNKNDALNQLVLGGRQQSISEILTERNQPLNEITALMSGSQVSQPGFTNTPQSQVAGVDYAGMVRDKYNAENQQYQAQMSQNNAAMGGMFGLGGTLAGGLMKMATPAAPMFLFSDRRAKKDIRRVGTLDNGLPVYLYTYKGDDTPQIGLMADEVEMIAPHAVMTGADGLKRVNYAEAVRA